MAKAKNKSHQRRPGPAAKPAEQHKNTSIPRSKVDRLAHSAVATPRAEEPIQPPGPEAVSKPDAAVTGRALPAAKSNLKKSIKSATISDWCMVALTIALSFIAHEQLTVTKNDERAWLKVDTAKDPETPGKVPVVVQAGEPLIMPMQVDNIGKSAAKRIDISTWVEVVPLNSQPHLEWVGHASDISNRSFTGIFFPGASQQLLVKPYDGLGRPKKLSQAEYEAIDTNQAGVVEFGMIQYDDIYGQRHWTKFCKSVTTSTTFDERDCANFNDEGSE